MLAMLAVGAVALIVPLVIALAMTVFVPASRRREIWGTVWKTDKDDLSLGFVVSGPGIGNCRHHIDDHLTRSRHDPMPVWVNV